MKPVYENPKIEEGINYSQEHPLKEFVELVLGVGAAILIALVVVHYSAGYLAKQIPFEYEQRMLSSLDLSSLDLDDLIDAEEDKGDGKANDYSAQEDFLQSLANKVAAEMDLPDGMTIKVHYSNSDTVNAFATLGGNLFFFKGLIEKMESEDELAAVMGHEIAHIKLRHPMVALGKGVTLAVLAASVSGASGSSAGEWLVGSSAQLGMLKFSRDQEKGADAESAKALSSLYGHIGGADSLFKHFAELEDSAAMDEDVNNDNKTKGREDPSAIAQIFRSHPYSEDRWTNLIHLAKQNNWSIRGSLKPLNFPSVSKVVELEKTEG
jgi:Zn-dependent protease with chaperone function